MLIRSILLASCQLVFLGATVIAQVDDAAPKMLNMVLKAQALEFRQGDVAPATLAEWESRRTKLRANLLAAWGGFPETPCPLEPRKMGELKREGYLVEKVIFQTLPGVWMTANLYVPDDKQRDASTSSKRPAVLCVHGHWAGAKQDPVVQSRCIGLVKFGFVVLCVDAIGAGERGVGKQLGQYHGEMVGATLIPTGRPLSGIQVYENMRAVDYLQSRPEVDPNKIGITGASGGGNQTMYAGAFDERFQCVVPTCSVGTYQAYLSAACCMCEVVPGALRFTEEGDVLGLAAQRGLMVTSATKDAFQFSVEEARKSFARLTGIAALYAENPVMNGKIRHTIIESTHHYNQPMREAMYGWMTLHLKGKGDGSPIPEPEIKTEDPEALRCFPGESRPDDYVTVPRLAGILGREQVAKHQAPVSADAWTAERAKKIVSLEKVLGGKVESRKGFLATIEDDGKSQSLFCLSEVGIPINLKHDLPVSSEKLVLLLDFDASHVATHTGEIAKKFRAAGFSVAALQLRGTEKYAASGDKIGAAPDHNSAEWSLWLGRPLLGQWVHDVRRCLDAIAEKEGSLPREIMVVGVGAAGPISLCAAALDERISYAVALNALASYVTDVAYQGQRLGSLAPGILRDVGDIAHVAALIAPRKVTIAGGVTAEGKPLDQASLSRQFLFTQSAFSTMNAAGDFKVMSENELNESALR